ncbi:unnamed protein product [Jaminaea pallidilutea]
MTTPLRILVGVLPALLVLLFASSSYAQQYSGAPISNSLPGVPGSEVTYWNIVDSQKRNTTLINYHILNNGKRQDPSKVKKALIVIHGLGQDPATYMSNALSALAAATGSNSAVNTESIAIVAPLFANGDQKRVAYPWTDGLATGLGSTSLALVWKGANWASGLYNQYPSTLNTVSSYTVLDQMSIYFANKTLYPNLNSIIIAGHSLGGQMVNRYAAVGKELGLSTPIRYWQGNPNDYLWFNTTRPVYRDPATACSTYDAWRQGMSSGTPNYNTALLNRGAAAVLANYRSKSKIYAKGTMDAGDDSSTCAPSTTGEN